MNISGNNPEFGPGIFLPSDVSAMERFFGSDDEDAVLARTLVENAKRFGLSLILPPLVIFCGSYTFARIIATKPLEKK